MKSKLSNNAVQRLGQFLNTRAQNYQDTEEWSPQDAVQDLLFLTSREFSDSLDRVFHNAVDVLLNTLSAQLPSMVEDLSKEFDSKVSNAMSQASAEGLAVPDETVLQELKARYIEEMQDALVHGVSNIQSPDFEGDELVRLFRDAAGQR